MVIDIINETEEVSDILGNMPEEPEGEHHETGPSALKFVEICPSFRNSGETSEAAEEGTMMHLACETGDLSSCDDDQKVIVQKALDYIDIVRAEGADFVIKERKVSIDVGHGDPLFGSIDEFIVFFGKKKAAVCDYKFGRNPIESADVNPQTLAYAIGGFQLFPFLEEIEVHFIIPRRDEILTHTFTRKDDLPKMIDRVKLIVQRATTEEAQYNANTEGCGWCGKRATCPALAEKLLPIANKYSDSAKDFEISLLEKLDPALIDDPAIIGQMKSVAQIVESWGKAVNKKALELAVSKGEEIPGYNLYYRNPSTKIDDPQKAYEAVSDLLSADEFMSACTASIPSLEKELRKKMEKGEKKLARSKIEQALHSKGLLPDEDDVVQTPYLRKVKN